MRASFIQLNAYALSGGTSGNCNALKKFVPPPLKGEGFGNPFKFHSKEDDNMDSAISGESVAYIIDIGSILVLILCAGIGAHRGMIRMIAGLAVLILALVGATFLSAQLTDPVMERLTPMVEARVTDAIEEMMEGQNLGELIGGYSSAQASQDLEETLDETSFRALNLERLGELFSDFASEHLLPQALTDALQERMEDMKKSFTGTASQALAAALTEILRPLVSALLYVISFFVLSIILKFLFRSLDSFADLPGMRSVNASGGLLLGFIQGFVVLVAVAFLLRFVLFAVDGVSQSVMLKFMALWFPSLAFP